MTIGNIDSGDTAYYTTDGSNPKTSSTTTEYTGSFTVSQSEIVRAAVEDSSGDWSRVTRARFIIDDNNSDNNYDNSNNDDDNVATVTTITTTMAAARVMETETGIEGGTPTAITAETTGKCFRRTIETSFTGGY